MAGGIAEEIIFGKQNASIGRSNDREEATMLAIDYVRKYGFDEEFQAVYNLDIYPYRMDLEVTDIDVEKMITRLVGETKEVLSQHIDLLKKLSTTLSLKGSMEAKEVTLIAQEYKLIVQVKEEGYLHIANYNSKIN